jgi:hypothetical protein
MNGRLSLSLLVCLLLIPPSRAAGQGKPAPHLSFEEKTVVASGLTAGGKVVWFGVERRIDEEFSTELARRYDVGTVEADGTARLELARPAALSSLWIAVDLKSGDYALAAPEGYRITRARKPSRLDVGQGALPDGILDSRGYVAGLAVRPGEGAWSFAGGDGGERDEDPSPGRYRFALDKLDPLADSPAAPAKLKADDLWFVVDLLHMEVSVHKGGVAQ